MFCLGAGVVCLNLLRSHFGAMAGRPSQISLAGLSEPADWLDDGEFPSPAPAVRARSPDVANERAGKIPRISLAGLMDDCSPPRQPAAVDPELCAARAPRAAAAAGVAHSGLGRLGRRLLGNATRALRRTAAALHRGQKLQANLIRHHNSSAGRAGTLLQERALGAARAKAKGQRKNSWTPTFALSLAFRRLASTTRQRETSRQMDAAGLQV